MTTKQLIKQVADTSGLKKNDVADMLDAAEDLIIQNLLDGNSILMQNFGTLEVKTKKERISVHPRTGVRTIVPPKQQITFKPNPGLRERIKGE